MGGGLCSGVGHGAIPLGQKSIIAHDAHGDDELNFVVFQLTFPGTGS